MTYSFEIEVPFPTEREAQIACNSLSVDPEPRRSGCTKVLETEEATLKVRFTASEARIIRVAVSSFLDYLILVINTIKKFGPSKA
ncbi:EKC/KEOPS complex subunit Lage3-like [Corticium candelabrum]|uniref:EKC/KEOPS complex subunit Lage3-like n=1 Tax=Corticium candelabrum TaxID=121492 RepID=UPI002E275544|nr:EKC/KEOPS complex subunit Lage3-like [Corticium candelabrum]